MRQGTVEKLVEKLAEITAGDKLMWEIERDPFCEMLLANLEQWRITLSEYGYYFCIRNTKNETFANFTILDNQKMLLLTKAVDEQLKRRKKNGLRGMTSQERQECISKLLELDNVKL